MGSIYCFNTAVSRIRPGTSPMWTKTIPSKVTISIILQALNALLLAARAAYLLRHDTLFDMASFSSLASAVYSYMAFLNLSGWVAVEARLKISGP